MAIDRRKFVTISAGMLLAGRYAETPAAGATASCMLKPTKQSGFTAAALLTIGESINGYRPPGIMDGMGAWRWDDNTVRLFVNHELGPDKGYAYTLANGTQLHGARISRIDIDRTTRTVKDAGLAFREIRDRRGDIVTDPRQVHEHWNRRTKLGLNHLCSAQGYQQGAFGFADDLLFTHEETSALEDHPHGGTVWALDVRKQRLWALPSLGRGSWENVTAVDTPDQHKPDGHIALIMGDDLEFGRAPLYLWLGRKQPDGDFPARNGLREGQLYVWVTDNGDRNPQDWHGTGTSRTGRFIPLSPRSAAYANQPGHDRDGWLNDTTLRATAFDAGAFSFSRPEDVHTNPANGSQVAMCSTGHGRACPADDWGTLYVMDVALNPTGKGFNPTAEIRILHDCDDFGDQGIRSCDNVVWASDGMLYIHEDKANKVNKFGGETGIEASTWRIDPNDPEDRERIAVLDRSVVLPANARDKNRVIGAWECCGLIDVTALFAADPDELIMLTAVQAHSIRGGDLGGNTDLFQGGQLVLLTKSVTTERTGAS